MYVKKLIILYKMRHFTQFRILQDHCNLLRFLSYGLHSRVHWFWHCFRNSICFMCFWFGLRLVFKKVSLKYWTVSFLFDLLSSEKSITGDLENSAEKCFSEKNLCELLDATFLHIFEISAEFHFFWYPLRQISKTFFKTLIRDGAIYLEAKRSNEIETVQWF